MIYQMVAVGMKRMLWFLQVSPVIAFILGGTLLPSVGNFLLYDLLKLVWVLTEGFLLIPRDIFPAKMFLEKRILLRPLR